LHRLEGWREKRPSAGTLGHSLQRYTSRNIAELCWGASPNIRKRTREKGRAGFLPQKRACDQPVQQCANQQAHAAQVEEAGVVVGHANALAANRMPHGKRRKSARTVTVPTCCVTSISGLSIGDEV
jgi:hypothetical protein